MDSNSLQYKNVFRDLIGGGPEPRIVDVPPMHFLAVCGEGDPNGSLAFHQAVEALYGTAYGIKFGRKKSGVLPDFSPGPIEALWWAAEESHPENKANWHWMVMLWVPDFIGEADVYHRVEELRAKKPNPALDALQLVPLHEGKAVQVIHVGPYDDEGPAIEAMHAYAASMGLMPVGRHHELYFSDPRRCKPENLKTMLRQAVR